MIHLKSPFENFSGCGLQEDLRRFSYSSQLRHITCPECMEFFTGNVDTNDDGSTA